MSDAPVQGLAHLGPEADRQLRRIPVWEDDHWRLTISLFSEIPGFAYLEPKRVIPDITQLAEPEAATFGVVLSRCARVLKEVTNCELVYTYIFGDTVPHLHVHLAPHFRGDVCCGEIVHGEHPLISETRLREIAEAVKTGLGGSIRMPGESNPVSSRFPNIKLLMLSQGQPFLYLQESGEPDGKRVAVQIVEILKQDFGAIPLGAVDGFDWVDVDFQIGNEKVTLTSDCWLGLGLIGECRDGEALLLRIANALDQQSANRITTEARE